ncbi:MAG: MFS family permease [Arenicella sp.]|jgi:MFS family permease
MTHSAPRSTPARAHFLLALLVLLNILNIVDRNLISSFGPQIIQDLTLSDTQFGLLTGLIFVFFYAVMGLFVGRLADTKHRPRLITAGLVLWSALTMISGAAKSFLHIASARLFIGVGEACLTPASMSMLADTYPTEKRGMAASLYYLGVPLGAGASFIIAGELGPEIGWRNCFYILGAIGLILAPVVYFLKDPERGSVEKTVQHTELEPSNLRGSLSEVYAIAKTSPALAWTMIGSVFMQLPVGSAQFAQIWLVRERGFDAAEIATTYGQLFIVIGVIGSLFGGIASDWYQQRFNGGRVRFLAIFMLVVLPFLVGYRLSEPGSDVFYIGMGAGFLALTVFYGPAFSTIQDLTPPRLRGVTTAVLLLFMNLIGLGLGAVTAGVLSDAFQALGVAEPLTWSLICIDLLGLFTIVSFFIASIYWARQNNSENIDKLSGV